MKEFQKIKMNILVIYKDCQINKEYLNKSYQFNQNPILSRISNKQKYSNKDFKQKFKKF